MSKRKDPASQVVEFFETASIETAQTVLAICRGIVTRRQPAKPTKTKRSSAQTAAAPVSGSERTAVHG